MLENLVIDEKNTTPTIPTKTNDTKLNLYNIHFYQLYCFRHLASLLTISKLHWKLQAIEGARVEEKLQHRVEMMHPISKFYLNLAHLF